jgi:mannose-6-phosphate isomerase-like protein (cupin superfamily)
MLSLLTRRSPPRTRICHLDRIYFDSGRSSIEFKSPSDRYLVINYWPPAATDEAVRAGQVPSKANCALAPALHWHRYQDETFYVLEGTAKFFLEGEERLAGPGDVVTIPMQAFHTFCNASEKDEMVVEFLLEPTARERDEEFFSVFN